MEGVIKVFKPLLWTSTECVEEIKKILRVKKAGHSGTLDPHAEGLLLVCLNSATKIIPFLLNLDKEYIGEAVLGIKTDTGDRGGNIIEYNPHCRIDLKTLMNAISEMKGKIAQVPPLYSAIKRKGKRLYEYAREGISDITLEPREIIVYEFEILSFQEQELQRFEFRIKCSKGTYIRKLIEDLGEKLGCGAFLYYLRRTRIGPFDLDGSVSPWEKEKLSRSVISLDEVIKALMPTARISPTEEQKIRKGATIELMDAPDGPLALFSNEGLIAIGEKMGRTVKPIRVFKP